MVSTIKAALPVALVTVAVLWAVKKYAPQFSPV